MLTEQIIQNLINFIKNNFNDGIPVRTFNPSQCRNCHGRSKKGEPLGIKIGDESRGGVLILSGCGLQGFCPRKRYVFISTGVRTYTEVFTRLFNEVECFMWRKESAFWKILKLLCTFIYASIKGYQEGLVRDPYHLKVQKTIQAFIHAGSNGLIVYPLKHKTPTEKQRELETEVKNVLRSGSLAEMLKIQNELFMHNLPSEEDEPECHKAKYSMFFGIYGFYDICNYHVCFDLQCFCGAMRDRNRGREKRRIRLMDQFSRDNLTYLPEEFFREHQLAVNSPETAVRRIYEINGEKKLVVEQREIKSIFM